MHWPGSRASSRHQARTPAQRSSSGRQQYQRGKLPVTRTAVWPVAIRAIICHGAASSRRRHGRLCASTNLVDLAHGEGEGLASDGTHGLAQLQQPTHNQAPRLASSTQHGDRPILGSTSNLPVQLEGGGQRSPSLTTPLARPCATYTGTLSGLRKPRPSETPSAAAAPFSKRRRRDRPPRCRARAHLKERPYPFRSHEALGPSPCS